MFAGQFSSPHYTKLESMNTFHPVSPKAVKKAPKGVTRWGLIRVKLQLLGRKTG